MVDFKIIVFVVGAFFVCSESAFVDTLHHKCGISDGDCLKSLLQEILTNSAPTGIEELEIPPFDPFKIMQTDLQLPGLKLTMNNFVLEGVKSCVINKFTTNIDDRHLSIELLCDLNAKSHYKVFSDSPVIKDLLGGKGVHGDGNGEVKIEKAKIGLDGNFIVEKRDGETYIKLKSDKLRVTYDIGGKVMISADNIYVGEEEQSAVIVKLMNENWKAITSTIGDEIVEQAKKYAYDLASRFFNKIPTKYYIKDDLSKYV